MIFKSTHTTSSIILLLSIIVDQSLSSFVLPKLRSVSTKRRTSFIGNGATSFESKRITTTTPIITSTSIHQSFANYQAQALKRRNVTLPLLDLTKSTSSLPSSNIITPLPSSHLPLELSTLHIYGMELKAAIYKMMIHDTLAKFTPKSSSSSSINFQEDIFGRDGSQEPMYGHLIGRIMSDERKDDEINSLVGCIGCASEIILSTPSDSVQIETLAEDDNVMTYNDFNNDVVVDNVKSIFDDGNIEDSVITVLTKGSFRFVVKEVIQTFPYPIAIVDELLDDDCDSSLSNQRYRDVKEQGEDEEEEVDDGNNDNYDNDEDEDDYDDYDIYASLTPSELMQRTLSAMKAIVDQKLDTKPKTMSPLELSILEQKGMSTDAAMAMASMQRDHAEEMAAIFDVFTSSLLDIAPSKTERYYSVAMLAAEFGGLDNDVRREMLLTLDGVNRLRIVLEAMEKKISLVQAKKLTADIVEKSDESSKDLKVRGVYFCDLFFFFPLISYMIVILICNLFH